MLAKTQLGDTYVKIHYSSPQRRNPQSGEIRTIFGGLVPYGQVWRTGANEATTFAVDKPVTVQGQPLPADFSLPYDAELFVTLRR